jgi:hypothetical protein
MRRADGGVESHDPKPPDDVKARLHDKLATVVVELGYECGVETIMLAADLDT